MALAWLSLAAGTVLERWRLSVPTEAVLTGVRHTGASGKATNTGGSKPTQRAMRDHSPLSTSGLMRRMRAGPSTAVLPEGFTARLAIIPASS